MGELTCFGVLIWFTKNIPDKGQTSWFLQIKIQKKIMKKSWVRCVFIWVDPIITIWHLWVKCEHKFHGTKFIYGVYKNT